jgi:hypothetical protein
MAQAIHQFSATIPANTAKNALATVTLAVPVQTIIQLDIEVPPGPGGLMGFYLAISGQQIIPFEAGEFIVWDDREREWGIQGYPTTGAWSVVGYNLDVANSHTIGLRFHTNPLPTPVSASTPVVSITTTPADQPALIL